MQIIMLKKDKKLRTKKSRICFINMSKNIYAYLIVGDHIIKSLVKLIRALLDLELLPVDLVLNIIDPVVQLSDVHLTILKPV